MKINHKSMIIGSLVVDERTKYLVNRLVSNQVAIIKHSDIDEIAAVSLIKKKPKAVINFSHSISGKYLSKGAEIILRSSIPLFDIPEEENKNFPLIKDGMDIFINRSRAFIIIPAAGLKIPIIPITMEYIDIRKNYALLQMNEIYKDFAINSLYYAQTEVDKLNIPFPTIAINTTIKNKAALVVVRGPSVTEDLESIMYYIHKEKPILIGVDGGADILYEFGLTPHIIIGDMDSVSDHLIKKVQDRIVHSYANGEAPGIKKMIKLNLTYHVLPFIGTSEDVALLLAYHYGADSITLVGSHSHMIDFLEKGREGMGSTILTRMKIGHTLIDVKGIHKLNTNKAVSSSYLVIASLLPFSALVFVSPDLKLIAYALWIHIQMLFK